RFVDGGAVGPEELRRGRARLAIHDLAADADEEQGKTPAARELDGDAQAVLGQVTRRIARCLHRVEAAVKDDLRSSVVANVEVVLLYGSVCGDAEKGCRGSAASERTPERGNQD